MSITLKMIGEVQLMMSMLESGSSASRMFARLERIESYLIDRYNELPRRWMQ